MVWGQGRVLMSPRVDRRIGDIPVGSHVLEIRSFKGIPSI